MSQRALVTILGVTILLLLALPPLADVHAESRRDFELPPVLRASDLLPAKVLVGRDHRVQETVYNDGFLNRYNLRTTFGRLIVEGTDKLMIRVSEVTAIRRMEDLRGTSVYGDAVKNAATGPLRLAKGIVTEPVDTVSDIGTGVGKFFSNVTHATFGDPSEHEESAAKVILGYDAYKRDFARQFGVDPYSSNALLQERLNEVSWTGFAGGMTVAVAFSAIPGAGGTVVQTTRFSEGMSQLVAQKTPAELKELNDAKLKAMGVHESLREIFLDHPKYSPTQMTYLVGALERMRGVADRQRFIQVAALVQTEGLAFWMRQRAEMMAGYHVKVAPVARVVRVAHAAALQRRDGTIIGLLPHDHVAWTRAAARLEAAASRAIEKVPNKAGKEMWFKGTVSPQARKNLVSAGWVVHENASKLALD